MAITNGKSTGMVSLLFLYLFAAFAGILYALKQVTFQEVDALVYWEQSRQWAELLSSFCRSRNGLPLNRENSIKELPPMGFPGSPDQFQIRVKTWQRGVQLRMEYASLHRLNRGLLMDGARYEIRPVGKNLEVEYPVGQIRDKNSGLGLLGMSAVDFAHAITSPMPPQARLEQPLEPYLYQTPSRKPITYTKAVLRGSGVLVPQGALTFSNGFRVEGDFRIYCGGSLTLGEGVYMDKVLLYSAGAMKIGKNSHINGIIVSDGIVELGENVTYTEDRSVLQPFLTRYLL